MKPPVRSFSCPFSRGIFPALVPGSESSSVAGDRQIQFLSTVAPPLTRGDVPFALRMLSEDWSRRELLTFLTSSLDAVAAAAARCVGYVGSVEDAAALARLLSHPSDEVASQAEDALWSIWVRAGGENARRVLASAIRLSEAGEPETALALLGDLCRQHPTFAEAYHQRGLILLGAEMFEAAREALLRALALNPLHYSAAANLGHVAVELGRLADALRHYREALQINPRLAEIAEILPDLEAAVARRVA